MSERHSFISATLAELNRRKVLRTVGAYAVGVFVLLQLMDAAVEPHTDLLRDVCRVEIDLSGRSLKAQAKAANQRLARVLLVAGDEEIAAGQFQLKRLDTGEQQPVSRDAILTAVREVLEQ